MSDRDIYQFMPAVGWTAVFKNDDGTLFALELIGWALKEYCVVGLMAYGDQIVSAPNCPDFVGYESPEQRSVDVTELDLERLLKQKRKTA